ncbi:hypothetical protein ACH4UM_00970 [Streptomyces sp. NPDC020801]|uniref:hypothetical protein n=1 Tax=Streptomyces sp. NPDC020801 TaxID=3365093 RepID=UPI0037BB6772
MTGGTARLLRAAYGLPVRRYDAVATRPLLSPANWLSCRTSGAYRALRAAGDR